MELRIILVKYHSILTDFAMPKHADCKGTGRDLSRNPLYCRQRIRRHFEKRSNSEPFETPFNASAAAVWGRTGSRTATMQHCVSQTTRVVTCKLLCSICEKLDLDSLIAVSSSPNVAARTLSQLQTVQVRHRPYPTHPHFVTAAMNRVLAVVPPPYCLEDGRLFLVTWSTHRCGRTIFDWGACDVRRQADVTFAIGGGGISVRRFCKRRRSMLITAFVIARDKVCLRLVSVQSLFCIDGLWHVKNAENKSVFGD